MLHNQIVMILDEFESILSFGLRCSDIIKSHLFLKATMSLRSLIGAASKSSILSNINGAVSNINSNANSKEHDDNDHNVEHVNNNSNAHSNLGNLNVNNIFNSNYNSDANSNNNISVDSKDIVNMEKEKFIFLSQVFRPWIISIMQILYDQLKSGHVLVKTLEYLGKKENLENKIPLILEFTNLNFDDLDIKQRLHSLQTLQSEIKNYCDVGGIGDGG